MGHYGANETRSHPAWRPSGGEGRARLRVPPPSAGRPPRPGLLRSPEETRDWWFHTLRVLAALALGTGALQLAGRLGLSGGRAPLETFGALSTVVALAIGMAVAWVAMPTLPARIVGGLVRSLLAQLIR